ncbi:PREDICTED: kinase suppressor of Ras 2 isoform X2 [Dinoponera quadriceps]|uniref:Kinase suppressor of Ras 2 isoform X2 n=1 Tax=Dinoponera quadriceps TaxID=609295 RepID=A0A6P3X0Z5_DINQU|nr:PREDICTED: kinase suppressor of Ras 2 isoform X2 [Dinoponera quadriceps]
MADGEDATEQEIRRALDVVQSMIDISADRLEGLRTQCSTSAELTQQEIRTLEGKLIKLYAKQLVTKAKLAADSLPAEMRQYPSLQQWLRVVGLTPGSIQIVCSKANSLEALKEKSEHELSSMLGENNVRYEEELRRLCRALHNLRRYIDVLVRGDMENNDMNLYWDSWDRHQLRTGASPRPIRSRTTRCSVPSEDSIPYHNNNNLNSDILAQASSVSSLTSTSPPCTPLLSRQGCEIKCPTTPPPCKKHHIGVQTRMPKPQTFPLTKSKSHESQLADRLENGDAASRCGNDSHAPFSAVGRRNRLPMEPGSCYNTTEFGESLLPNSNSPVKSPPSNAESDDNSFKGTVTSLQVPKSPRTPTVTRGMGHIIAHRFTKTFKMMTTCDYCEKQMFIGTGLKCKECKYKCHRDCESKVPPSCGLPQELFDEFKRTVQADGMINASPILSKPGITSPNHHNSNLLVSLNRRDRKRSHPHSSMNIPFQGADSSSNTSSCNSSTPSSPALLPANTSQTPQAPVKQQFHFPVILLTDVVLNEKGVTLETHKLEGTTMSSDSERTVSVSGSGSVSTDSERTPVRVDSQDSQVSDGEPGNGRWPRQNSLSMREWDIPFDELKIGEPIGTGRFGTVYRGNWHGDVAIKVLNMDYYLDDDKILEAFKLEVATFRKTRHENLVLFMGACMKPPRLAIVTSMSKGMTLYTHIHLRKDKFTMNKTTNIAQQISQGMGYLHARGIVHKDLKSKNIFLENGKVVITDFGLFSVTKLCYGNRKGDGLSIPPGWLCYLAPEIVRRLRPQQNRDQEELPFTAASDVYAFGTVWYELLCGEWPFKGQPPEAIIWQVGKGMKQTLANLQASREVKDILMHCWSYHAENRPDFAKLLTTLEKLPRKRLARSPSHPIHLSRSVESVF